MNLFADRLSDAEREVVVAVLAGQRNREIAARRGTSERTVAHQIAAAYKKLRVQSRGELAARAPSSMGPSSTSRAPNPGADRPSSPLTDRERVVASHAALGRSNKRIAYDLGLAESAVAMRLSRAYKKLGVRSRVDLIQALREVPAEPRRGEPGSSRPRA
jgi:DNA-binding CsgD family transcriptional regulator